MTELTKNEENKNQLRNPCPLGTGFVAGSSASRVEPFRLCHVDPEPTESRNVPELKTPDRVRTRSGRERVPAGGMQAREAENGGNQRRVRARSARVAGGRSQFRDYIEELPPSLGEDEKS